MLVFTCLLTNTAELGPGWATKSLTSLVSLMCSKPYFHRTIWCKDLYLEINCLWKFFLMSSQNLPSCDLQPLTIIVDLTELSETSAIWDWKVGARAGQDRKEEKQDQYIKTMSENSLLEQHKEGVASFILFLHEVTRWKSWRSRGAVKSRPFLQKAPCKRNAFLWTPCSLANSLSGLSNSIWTGTEMKSMKSTLFCGMGQELGRQNLLAIAF